MTATRAFVVLTGAIGMVLLAPVVHASPAATFGGADWRLLALEIAAAFALLLLSLTGAPSPAGVLLAIAGSLWIVPELAGGAPVSQSMRTLSDSAGYVIAAIVLSALVLRRGNATGELRAPILLAVGGCSMAVLARLLLVDPFDRVNCWRTCLNNPLYVGGGTAGSAIERLGLLALAAGCLWAAARTVSPRRRPGLPVRALATDLAGWFLLASLLAALLVWRIAGAPVSEDQLAVILFVMVQVGAVGWLGALGWEAWLRWRLQARLARLVDLLSDESDPDALANHLRTAVGDPSLRLAYSTPSRPSHVDSSGRTVSAFESDDTTMITEVARRGQTIAVIAHSRRVDGHRLARAMGPALRLALENAQLRAAALAELEELTRSRARVVTRAELERKRLERNLHDGAQQRAVSLVLMTRVLVSDAEGNARNACRQAEASAQLLVEELRRVARGIYPAVLGDAGLVGALVDLAEHSEHLPVIVGDFPERRFQSTVEDTAYLGVRSGLADAASRGATCARVSGVWADGLLQVRIEDDGLLPPSSPMRLVDQVRALGGTLEVGGSPGRRRVEVGLPCVS
jgi:signal transduction histidine kinase